MIRGCQSSWLIAVVASVIAVTARGNPSQDERTEIADTSQIDVIIEEVQDTKIHVPDDLTMRVRVLALEPFEPTPLQYKYGGWGSPGDRVYGWFWKPGKEPIEGGELHKELKREPDTFQLDEWTEHTPLKIFVPGGATNPRFLQVFCGDGGKLGEGRHPSGGRIWLDAAKRLKVEFEFYYSGKLLKSFVVEGPDGPIAPIVIPFGALTGEGKPSDREFQDNLVPLRTWVTRKADEITRLKWADGPKPDNFAMVTNLGGYGPTHRLGVRHSDPAIVEQEVRILRAMGINGFQAGPSFLVEQAMKGTGIGAPFCRADSGAAHGYPVPRWTDRSKPEHAGCPCAPVVEQAKKEAAAGAVEQLRAHRGFFLVKGTTEDEIGTVIDRSKEGKAHLSVCSYCRDAFQDYLRSQGLTPADFGDADWSHIAPLMVWGRGEIERPWMEDRREAMLAYWTRRFNCFASAQLFSELRKTAREQNAKKRAALARGDTDSSIANQPWHYPGAMRGNSFLMSGHSLDFFNFYRVADNAFIYETSNRDARVWAWDSYLCDVGRVVTSHPRMSQELFGVYVKPHRGAGIQRGLTAVSRGARYINWYTYGPPYAKGDTWGHKLEVVAQVGRANKLIAAAEDVLYGGRWSHPARIAVVKPRASEIWMQLSGNAPLWTAAWENAKWVYIALTHAHLPVDPIDQVMIREDELSRYDVIYINGPNLERAAAVKIAEWVEAGGTLVTMGFGLARDEYNQPLQFLQPVLGLKERVEPEMWHATRPYRATSLHEYDDQSRIGEPSVAESVRVKGAGMFRGETDLTVGREVLEPSTGTNVLAKYGDGGGAVTHHRHGRGHVYVIGFFAGLEYVVPLMNDRFNMQRDFDAARRLFATAPAIERVAPVVDASQPTIEGVLLRHPESGKQVVTLMNWAYGVTAVRRIKSERGEREQPVVTHLPAANVTITVRGIGDVLRVHSVALRQDLAIDATPDGLTIRLPQLNEGDILVLQ